MPRLVKDSDEEAELKSGRRTRILTEAVSADSPLRRSTRNRTNTKQNESSPESPLSDTSNVSNTQTTRVTRRRTIAMDSITATENHRNLRSRMNSVSSDISEITETDIGTPKKKTGNNSSSDAVSKINNRRSKRFTRAGSEVSTSPVIRTTRTTRSTSVGPDATAEKKLADRHNSPQMSTPLKTRRQTLVSPLEATVVEEKEEVIKIPVVSLDRTLPKLKELEEPGDPHKSTQINESLSNSKDADDIRNNSINEGTKDDSSVKGLHDNPPDSFPSNRFEDSKREALFDDENTLNKQSNQQVSVHTKTQIKSQIHNEFQILAQNENGDTFKEEDSKHDLVNKFLEKPEDNSNKENLPTNVIDLKSTDDETFNILQSPKSASTVDVNVSKLESEISASGVETNSTPKYRRSKEVLEILDELPLKVVPTNSTMLHSESIEKMDISVNKGDNSNDSEQLLASTETELVADNLNRESPGRNVSSKTCKNSNVDDSITIMECSTDIEVVNESSDQTDIQSNHKSDESHGKESSEVPRVEESVTENVEAEKNYISENEIKDNKYRMEDEHIDLNKEENILQKDTDTNIMETCSFTDLNSAESSKSAATTLNTDIQQSTLKSDDIHNLRDTDETNNLCSITCTLLESSDARMSPKGSTFNKSNEDNVIKNSQSSNVTETPGESIEEAPEGEELSTKVFVPDSSLTLKKEPAVKPELNERDSSINEEKSNKDHESMEINDSDSVANMLKLFKHVTVAEWKAMNADTDKNSVHSMSTERLENESEGECDLILVDKEAWLAAENMKSAIEKEPFDYDSDDTVLLKTKKDLAKSRNAECKLNISKDKISNLSHERKSMEQMEGDKTNPKEDIEDTTDMEEDVEESTNADEKKGVAKDSSKHLTSKYSPSFRKSSERNSLSESQKIEEEEGNISLNKSKMSEDVPKKRKSLERKSLSESQKNVEKEEDISLNKHKISEDVPKKRKSLERKSLSESQKTIEKEENATLNESKISEDVPKRRKSLGKSIQETSKLDTSDEPEIVRRRVSLNKFNLEEVENSESETSIENVKVTSPKKLEKRLSLNSSVKKEIKRKQLKINSTDESEDELKQNVIQDKRDSVKKRKFTRNYSTVANIDSDSDESKDISDLDSIQDRTVKLPKFLFGGSSDSNSEDQDKSDESICSDIEREYNLHGKSISKFSDDDVPGDECRASETESSDPNDDGSDLADFVVDDDEVEEDEEDEKEDGEGEEAEDEVNDGDGDNDDDIGNENREEVGENIENGELDNIDVEDSEADEVVYRKVKKMQVDEEMETEEEMQADEEAEKEACPEDQSDSDKDNVEVKFVSRTVDTSIKDKSRKSGDLNLSQITRSSKKNKSQLDTPEAEGDEKENSLADISLSIFETTKKQQTRASGDFIVEDVEQPLNESQRILNKKLTKLSKSIECSTPKIHASKREKFNTSIQMNASLEETHKKPSSYTLDVQEDEISHKEGDENTTLKEGHRSKKFHKMKANESLIHRSLPSELIELISNTNLSRTMSSKVVELNKTTFVPESETPTTKYLKKNKLNESAPVLKLDTKFKKLKKTINDNNQNDPDENENVSENECFSEQSITTTENMGESLKEKLLKVADGILENDQRKKRKRRRQSTVETDNEILREHDFDKDSIAAEEKNKTTVSIVNIDSNAEMTPPIKKKRGKKMKTRTIDVCTEEKLFEDVTEKKSENNDKKVHKDDKKKKQKEKVVGAVSNLINTKNEPKIVKKKKKDNVSDTLLSGAISDKQKPKKKQKKQKTLSKDILEAQNVPQDEKLPKKKTKKLQSIDNILEQDADVDKKACKKKVKMVKDTSEEKNVVGNIKRITSSESKGFSNAESCGGARAVVSSKDKNKALNVLKRHDDRNEGHKETKNKKQKERMEESQKEDEAKINSKKQTIKTNKVDSQRKGLKRLSDEFLENLSDVPMKPLKRRKVSKMEDQTLSLGLMQNSKDKEIKNVGIEDDFTLPSTSGSTTVFCVTDLRKMKKKKKRTDTLSFRQNMIARKSRQPISAYLMYLEKQKASGKNKFCSRPY